MSKKYVGKTCAYCAKPGASESRDHVLAREFFLKTNRGSLPQVPACRACNKSKSDLERYALAVLPFGSRRGDALAYAEQNLERRLSRDEATRSALKLRHDGGWETSPAGLIAPAMTIEFDSQRLHNLLSMIIRGLFMHHWSAALPPDWYADVQMFDPQHENDVISQMLNKVIVTPRQPINGNIGDKTFVYKGVRNAIIPDISLWQFTMFNEMEFLGETFGRPQRLTRFYAVTRKLQNATSGEFVGPVNIRSPY